MSVRNLIPQYFTAKTGKSIDGTKHEVAVGPQATAVGAEAAAMSGFGLHLSDGEHVLATVTRNAQNKGDHTRGVMAVTNRRTIASGWTSCKGGLNGVRGSLRHDEIISAESNYGLRTFFRLHTQRGDEGGSFIWFFSEYRKIGEFFTALVRMPAAARVEAPVAMTSPSEADPSGALGAMQSLWFEDPLVAQALGALAEQVRAGSRSPADAGDLVARLVLAHRTRLCGPAGIHSAYLSAMSAADLLGVLASVLGPPAAVARGARGETLADFALSPHEDRIGPGLRALGVASYLTIGVGFSVGRMIAQSMLAKTPLTMLRVSCADMQGGCWYTLDGNTGPIHETEAMFAAGVGQLLAARAAQVIARRVERGWDVPFAEL